MNKRHKLLSLLLSTGIVASAFPSSGTGATSDSIAFYNSKKAILDMRDYDEAYDTNHDGVVNVFDVIRENKEVFQEESYTDLKSQIHSLETQIEILTQKLTEKEDKHQVESDISGISLALSGKVDNQEGKQLSTNDYTDEDKNKLASLENYNDKDIKAEISSINSELSSINDSVSCKVDRQDGKQLSSNDYTDSDKEKLKILENYDDTKINDKIDSLVQVAYEEKKEIESSIGNKVDKEDGKQLSSNDYTNEEKQKLESLHNYDDSSIKNDINNINKEFSLLKEKQERICNFASSDGIPDSNNYIQFTIKSGEKYIIKSTKSVVMFTVEVNEWSYPHIQTFNVVANAEYIFTAENDANYFKYTCPLDGCHIDIYSYGTEFSKIQNEIESLNKEIEKTNDRLTYINNNGKTADGDSLNLSGLVWTSFGDSITYKNEWQPYIIEKTGVTHYNAGQGGSCVGGDFEDSFWKSWRLNDVKINNPDIVTIMGGANDISKNPNIGTIEDLKNKNVDTFIGAYSYIIDNLLTWKPSLKIIILGTTATYADWEDVSGKGLTCKDFSDACKLVADYYGLPFVDLNSNCFFNHYTIGENQENQIYSSDCVHPNVEGSKTIASNVYAKMKEVFMFLQ